MHYDSLSSAIAHHAIIDISSGLSELTSDLISFVTDFTFELSVMTIACLLIYFVTRDLKVTTKRIVK